MTHHDDSDLLYTVLQQLTAHGSSSLAECFRILLNEAMRQERSAVLQAKPYERCEERLGYANGFKPKTFNTRMGEVELRIPQVRDGIEFYPNALQRGVRSEQALHLRMRTSNAIERVNQELKRRTRVAALFPNEDSLLRLISALLCEQSDEWSTGKIYLNMNSAEPSQT